MMDNGAEEGTVDQYCWLNTAAITLSLILPSFRLGRKGT